MATLHLQFFSSLCTIINSIEGPRKHPTNWAPQLLRPALVIDYNDLIVKWDFFGSYILHGNSGKANVSFCIYSELDENSTKKQELSNLVGLCKEKTAFFCVWGRAVKNAIK